MSKYIFTLSDCEKWERIKQEAKLTGKRPRNPISGGHMPEDGPLYRQIEKQCGELRKNMLSVDSSGSRERDPKRLNLPGGVLPQTAKLPQKVSLSPKPMLVSPPLKKNRPSRSILKSALSPKNSSRRVVFNSLPAIEEVDENENYIDEFVYQVTASMVSTPCHIENDETIIPHKESIEKICKYPSFSYVSYSDHYVTAIDGTSTIKVGYTKRNDILDNGFEVENAIYREIFSCADLISPNLPYYTIGNLCDSVIIGQDTISDESTIKRVILLDEVIEIPVSSILDTLSENQVFLFIFQILYNIEYFSRINLRHNTLLLDNIFIDKNSMRSVVYNINDLYLKQITPYIYKIMNFENSSIYNKKVPRNFTLDLGECRQRNACNEINQSYDIYTFISSLYRSIKDFDDMPDVISFIEEHLPSEHKSREMHGDILSDLINLLISKRILKVIQSTSDSFSLPLKESIKWGRIKLPYMEDEFIDSSEGIKEEKRSTLQMRMIDIIDLWNHECKLLNYDQNTIYKDIYEQYLEYSEDMRSEDFDKVASRVCTYLSYPMFYKFSNDQLAEVLTKSEKKVFFDIMNVFRGELPILIPIL